MKFHSNIVEKYLNRNLIEEEKAERQSRELFQIIMFELGFPPSDTLFPAEIKYILDLYSSYNGSNNEQLKKEIISFLIHCYKEKDLSDLLEGWGNQPVCHSRIHIMKEIIKGHSLGFYNLTVPTILSQIEGVIATGFNHKGRMTLAHQKQYISELLSATDSGSFDKTINAYFLQTILVNFEHGSELKSDLSRHAILHGADINFGTHINSLKCILIFDYLLYSIKK